MVAINRLTGHSPGFFSVYTLPPNQAVSARAQRKINEQRGQTPPDRDVKGLILRKTKSLLSDGPMAIHPSALLTTGPAQSTPAIRTGSVRLVVTSPPFLDVVQYAEDNWLRSWFAGIDVTSVAIERHRIEAAWQNMVRETLVELARVVQPSGYVAFEVGEVRNGKVPSPATRLGRSQWTTVRPAVRDGKSARVHQDCKLLGRSKQLKGDQHQ